MGSKGLDVNSETGIVLATSVGSESVTYKVSNDLNTDTEVLYFLKYCSFTFTQYYIYVINKVCFEQK